MSKTLEERLAAWLDGELSPEEAAAFEREMEADPALAERAADWRATDTAMAGAFAPLAAEPIDAAMLARLGLAEPAAQALAANDNPPFWRRHALPLGGALAASLALVAFLGLQHGPVRPDPLSLALDTTPSGQVARLADGTTVAPVLTVRARDGRWCREYRTTADVALACREAEGWKVEAQDKAAAPEQGGDFALAGDEQSAAIDAAYDRIGASDPLGKAEETAIIGKKWGDR